MCMCAVLNMTWGRRCPPAIPYKNWEVWGATFPPAFLVQTAVGQRTIKVRILGKVLQVSKMLAVALLQILMKLRTFFA